ncbi:MULTISPECIES: hypothetical protein [Legionella]|uniref:Uncharacterized protein n=1 Tax=Legionella steelei TaxID=947033 RepID=A0A0W0ZKX0_9GAMM|nr:MULTISPECIES: hypothetical protein [Legionella]KTD69411.1 hypothetical protein Lste_2569 [Legionella steelei]
MLKNNPAKPDTAEKPARRLVEASLKRQLSVSYVGPRGLTSDDPDSYQGQERIAYQDALISQRPRTGYADGILARREEQKARFFSQEKEKEHVEHASAPTPP